MSKTYIQPGDFMDWTNDTGSDVSSGDVVVVGSNKVCVATGDIDNGDSGVLACTCVHKIPKASGAISQCAKVYWDEDGNPYGGTSGAGAMTTTSSGNTYAGYAFAAAGASDTHVYVKLDQ